MKTRLVLLLFALFLDTALFAQRCGPNLSWSFASSTLTISGTGPMYDYGNSTKNSPPWDNRRYDITSVVINNGVTTIGEFAFCNCSNLVSVSIPGSVTKIGAYAFGDCNLTSISIPQGVSIIGSGAFSSRVESIIVDSRNTTYDSRENCNAIIETASNTLILGCHNTIIPNSVSIIGDRAFIRSYLTAISIPNGVTYIGDEAFWNSKWLKSVSIPNSLKRFGESVFEYCNNLTYITYNSDCISSLATLNFYTNEYLTSITFNSNTLTSCDFEMEGENLAWHFGSVSEYVFGDNVTCIGKFAFSYSPVTTITFGTNVSEIRNGAFYGNERIQTITCYSTQPPSVVVSDPSDEGTPSFSDLPPSTVVYVPLLGYITYRMHDFWGQFNLQPMLDYSALDNVFENNTLAEILANPETQVFTLQGNNVTAMRNNLPTGIYILRCGNKAGKICIK